MRLRLRSGSRLRLCVGLLVLSSDITRVLFQHGAFTADDTLETASVSRDAGARPAAVQVISETLSASFFGRGDTKTPMTATLARPCSDHRARRGDDGRRRRSSRSRSCSARWCRRRG